jgi:putative spermidine/putrescine transport system substrate-binding protein
MSFLHTSSFVDVPRAGFIQFSRLIGWVLGCALGLALLVGCAKDEGRTGASVLTVVSYGGGAYQQSHRIAFCEPFSLFTGDRVQSVVWNADYGKLKAMVQSGNVQWDVVEVTAAQFARGRIENLYEKLSIKPTEGSFLPGCVTDYGVANVYWSTVLAYRKDKFSGTPPKEWKDFFDPKSFRGARALYDDPRGNLEFALIADGVSPKGLYPLDVERAFRKLDQIKPYVRAWWTDGTQPVQMLQTGTVDLSSAWSGRIYASSEAKKSIGYSWAGAALELDYWIVPRGSNNIDKASRFIAFASNPYFMAKQATLVGYGPANTSAIQYVPDSVRAELPTYAENWDASFVVDAQWWSDHESDLKARWLAWKAR